MGLETGTYVNDLVVTNPVGATDARQYGDDHLRLIKSVLKNTFPGMAGTYARVSTKSAPYTVLSTDNTVLFNCTTTLTLSLTAAATLGNGHTFAVLANGGTVTIDPNGSETINESTTLTLPSGYAAIVWCTGSAFFGVVVSMQKALLLSGGTLSGLLTFAAGSDIAASSTLDLTAATGNIVRVTGTTTTTDVTINNGQSVLCYATDAWPLTHHATNLPLPGGTNYTCTAGDLLVFTKDGNGTKHVAIIPTSLVPAVVSQAVAEAGTDTTPRLWTAERVAQAIAALSGGGGTPTGTVFDYVGSTAPSGYVFLSGRTIGNAASGATERANADTEALFTLLWNSMSDTEAPVSGGRGASAAADFAANKTITLPDARGRIIAGKDNMGGTTASRITSGGSGITGTTLGASGGAETVSLTSAQNGSHTHTTTTINTHIYGTYGIFPYGKGATQAQYSAVTSSSSGSGSAHQNMPPVLILNKIIKL